MDSLMEKLDWLNGYIWGAPMLILLMGTGLLLTFRLKLLQVTKLPRALALIFTAKNEGAGDVSSFKSLCTALAATVGVGNIVGVATAIAAGGPGALFWMWMAAFLGIATKYAEGLLAIKYRTFDERGEALGGPMRYIEMGLGPNWKWLAVLFALFGSLAAFLGIGTSTQVNAIVTNCQSVFGVPVIVTGLIVTVLIALVVLGGLKSIATASSAVVPFMCVVYFLFGLGILFMYSDQIPAAFALVFRSAFTQQAGFGGLMGATFAMAIRSGVARGIFSNEAGLGSAPIASAAAKTKWAAEQGLISMTGTFIDTIIICSITGLSIILTGTWTTVVNQLDASGQVVKGALSAGIATQMAFETAYPGFGGYVEVVCLVLFAFTTILGWAYYGERCCAYLFGVKGQLPYRIIYIISVGTAIFLPLDLVWTIADITNGLMAFPNLIALVALSGVIVAETKKYFDHLDGK